MGMYNEVFKQCPNCKKRGREGGYLQITQIVLGFGEFDLDDKFNLFHHSVSTLELLEQYIKEELSDYGYFACQSCGHTFKLWNGAEDEQKAKIINRLVMGD
jgi:hypothetical protein